MSQQQGMSQHRSSSLEDRGPAEGSVSHSDVPCSNGSASRDRDPEMGLIHASASLKAEGAMHIPQLSCDRQLVSIDELPSHSLDGGFSVPY